MKVQHRSLQHCDNTEKTLKDKTLKYTFMHVIMKSEINNNSERKLNTDSVHKQHSSEGELEGRE